MLAPGLTIAGQHLSTDQQRQLDTAYIWVEMIIGVCLVWMGKRDLPTEQTLNGN